VNLIRDYDGIERIRILFNKVDVVWITRII
jgi:hypothetical protein